MFSFNAYPGRKCDLLHIDLGNFPLEVMGRPVTSLPGPVCFFVGMIKEGYHVWKREGPSFLESAWLPQDENPHTSCLVWSTC